MLLNLEHIDINTYIYRIISLERLLQLFHTGSNVLVSPTKWEDSFENFILNSKVRLMSGEIVDYGFGEEIYGQCWTLHDSSDAMWRIYSSDKSSVRIRTTIGALYDSLCLSNKHLAEVTCCIGGVQYCSESEIFEIAHTIFDDYGISVDNIFKSLLLKRNAFSHENEVRLLHHYLGKEKIAVYGYKVNPHDLISEITIDPRKSDSEFEITKLIIEKSIGYTGIINKSDLYSLPKIDYLDVTNKLS